MNLPAMKLKLALTDERVGAVIQFGPGVTEDEVQGLIDSFRDKVSSAEVHTFDPRLGTPVWYIP